ncbi:MAG: DUF99 family protein [Candidatus Nanohaloarchaea archaeon]
MKSGTRFLGIDDSSHDKFSDSEAFLVGVAYRGTEFVEDIRKTGIEIDGGDATEKIIELYESAEASTVGCILLDGISFAGLNIVDLEKVTEETGVPVVAVTKNEPDREKFYEALEIVGNEEGFWEMEDPETVELEDGEVYVQYAGTDFDGARETVEISTLHGLTPEAIRVADMIGSVL